MSPSPREDGITDPYPTSPGPRALDAMEHAVRRARESAGDPVGPTPPHGVDAPTALHDTLQPEGGPKRRPTRRIPAERWLVFAVAVAALLVVGGAGGLAVALTNGSGPGQVAAPPIRTPTNLHASRPAHGKAHAKGPAVSPQTGATTTTSAPVVITGTAPVISSLSPASGNTGQTVQISGGNFLSTNGQIVASFGGTAASTDCPTQSTCTVTVPTGLAPSASVPVTITTAQGVSNTVTFTFG